MPSSPALRQATRNSSRYVRHDARTVKLDDRTLVTTKVGSVALEPLFQHFRFRVRIWVQQIRVRRLLPSNRLNRSRGARSRPVPLLIITRWPALCRPFDRRASDRSTPDHRSIRIAFGELQRAAARAAARVDDEGRGSASGEFRCRLECCRGVLCDWSFREVRRVLRGVPFYELMDGRLVDVAFRDGVDAGRVVNDCRVVRSRMKCRCPQCTCFCS